MINYFFIFKTARKAPIFSRSSALSQTTRSRMPQAVFGSRQVKVNGSLALSKVLEPDAAEYLFDSLLPDMVQLALRASELCTKVTPYGWQRLTGHMLIPEVTTVNPKIVRWLVSLS